MKKKQVFRRLLSGVLAAAMTVTAIVVPTSANEGTKLNLTEVSSEGFLTRPTGDKLNEVEEEEKYADTDVVRVSIFLDDASTIKAGFDIDTIATDKKAIAYRDTLKVKQEIAESKIEKATSEDLDVVHNLTLAANVISANVKYGQIKDIEKISGVKTVVIENQYEAAKTVENLADDPNMSTSTNQIGSNVVWAEGYTGAGSKIAVIDTGIDTTHVSFDEGAYLYSLSLIAEEKGMTLDEYKATLNLLDAEYIEKVADQLNVKIDADKVNVSEKIPFAYNYVDGNYDVTHANDTQGEHGSHVEGIAAANKYIKVYNNTYIPAISSVLVQGVAPDAQIITMKVFGSSGGAYDSDYMLAIEDAIVLGADAINLSLGSGMGGTSKHTNAVYQEIFENLSKSGAVVSISAGNAGHWADSASTSGYLYADDVNAQTDGSPGSYTNAFTVASADNIGLTGEYFTIGETPVVYTQTDYTNKPLATLAGEQEYIYLDAVWNYEYGTIISGGGTEEEWAAIGDAVKGKIAVVSRGLNSFYQKAEIAVAAGAIGVIVYNNEAGSINMDLSGYTKDAPVVSITQAEGALFKENGTISEDGKYYTGTINIEASVGATIVNTGFSTISSFSSWGVPGSLELKPEITAPGGNIYSVHGYAYDELTGEYAGGGDSYENMSGTSMAAPQIAGMSALAAQYIRENGLEEQTGLKARTLAQSLLMSTAVPMMEDLGEFGVYYYPVLRQGAGLANIGNVVKAESYILMDEDANAGAADGKVKVELGDDPDKKGVYSFGFTIYNLTDTAKTYTLSADMFAQYIFADEDENLYMDTSTEYLEATAVFDCGQTALVPANGETHVTATITLTDADREYLDYFESGAYIEGYVYASPDYEYDFDGDGDVDEDDGQRLLDYRTGVATVLYNEDHADFDEDGDIDTYDAYLFLELLAEGELNIVEGEGIVGTTHSIPVFGFYGNWSTASMFDKGSYVDYNLAGTEDRTPYLNNKNVNAFGVTYGDDGPYYLGGNLMLKDLTYHADRVAVNNTNGTYLSMVQYAAIRNAADSLFTIVNDTTGETILETTMGAVTAAYYYTNGGEWRNTAYSFKPNYNFSGAKENEKVTISFALAPEYYQDARGNVRWEDVDMTNALTTTVTIDNTAPEIISAVLNGDTLTVTAKDNQYISAIALVNKGNTKTYAAAGSSETQKAGDEVKFELDVADVSADQLYLMVYDYALNVTTYAVPGQFGEGTIVPNAIAFDAQNNVWVTYDQKTDTLAELEGSNHTFLAATIADHLVYAVDDEGTLYTMPEKDLSDTTRVSNLFTQLGGPIDVFDMAYDPITDSVVAIVGGIAAIFIDPVTGQLYEDLAWLPFETSTLAIDDEGTWYSMADGTNLLCAYNPLFDEEDFDIVGEFVDEDGDPLKSSTVYQAMEYDPNTGKIYWAWFDILDFFGLFQIPMSTMVEIDVNAEDPDEIFTAYEDHYFYQLTSLIFPDKSTESITPDWAKPTDDVTEVIINSTRYVTMLKDQTTQLTADVLPWTAKDKSVIWESSDEKVATVDENGKVTAVAPGTAIIFASANADDEVYDYIYVTVELMEVTIEGALQDTDGNPLIFKWDLANDETWSKLADLKPSLESLTLNTDNGHIYVMDSQGFNMYEIDPEDGSIVNSASGVGIPYFDIAYSESFSTADAPVIFGVYGGYVLQEDPTKDLEAYGWNLSSTLANYTGADTFIGIVNMGMDEDEDGEYEKYGLLDNTGALWVIGLYDDEGGPSLALFSLFENAGLNEAFEGLDEYDYGVSMVMGDDGSIYVSVFNLDDNRNNLYQITITGNTRATKFIGCTEDGVWPMMLASVTANKTAAASAADDNSFRAQLDSAEAVTVESGFAISEKAVAIKAEAAEIEKINVEEAETEKINIEEAKAAYAESSLLVLSAEDAVEDEDEIIGDTSAEIENNKVTVDIVAVNEEGEAVNTNNGLFKVTYNASKLTLVDSEVNSEYKSVNDKTVGTVIIGYVNTEEAIKAGAEAAELVFTVKEGEELDNSDVIIEHVEVGDVNFETEEDIEAPVQKPLPDPEDPEDPENPENPEDPTNPDESSTDESSAPEYTPESSQPDVVVPDETTSTSDDTTTDPDSNTPTGVAIAFVPAVIAAAGVIAAKKRKNK